MKNDRPHIAGKYQTSMREYLGNVPALNRGTRFSVMFGALAVVLAVLSLPYLVPVALELALAVALLSGYASVPFAWLTLRSRRQMVEQPVEVFADDAGLHFTHGVIDLDVPWAEIDRLRENRDSFFVMATQARVYIIPKRAFDPDQIDAFRQLVASSAAHNRG
jgi:hypothetical protein